MEEELFTFPQLEVENWEVEMEEVVECRELGGRGGGSRRIVYLSSVSPKDGSGRSQASADQGDLSTVQLFQILANLFSC